MSKNEPHLHDWQNPVLAEDNENYLVKCSGCPFKVKITKAQYLKGWSEPKEGE